jgi:hypothetical protein
MGRLPQALTDYYTTIKATMSTKLGRLRRREVASCVDALTSNCKADGLGGLSSQSRTYDRDWDLR